MPGVINPPAANKHGYWTNDEAAGGRQDWLETATRHEGSWWPWWTEWLDRQGLTARRSPRASRKTPIEPAPGRYAMMP